MRTPGHTFRSEWKSELQKMKSMTFREKVSYFFTYYKHLIVIFLIICLFGYFISEWIVEIRKEIVLEGFFTNDEWDLFNASLLSEEYREQFGLEGRRDVRFDDTLYIDTEGSVTEFSAASASKISAYLNNQELDFIVTVQPVFDYYSGTVRMWDLRELLPEDLLVELEDYLIYAPSVEESGEEDPVQPGDESGEGAYALDLTACRYVTGVGAHNEPLVDDTYMMFVPKSAPHPEALIEYIRFLFDWE